MWRSPTVIAALIAAVAAIVAVLVPPLLNSWGADTESSSPARTESPSATGAEEPANDSPKKPASSVSIKSWTESTEKTSPKTLVFSGTVSNTPGEVHVVIQLPRSADVSKYGASYGAKWLVSPAAHTLSGNRWTVTWKLKKPPPSGRWMAVLVDAPGPHPSEGGPRFCGPNEVWEVEEEGPESWVVVATATAPRDPRADAHRH